MLSNSWWYVTAEEVGSKVYKLLLYAIDSKEYECVFCLNIINHKKITLFRLFDLKNYNDYL